MDKLKPCPFCGRTPTVDDCGDHRYFIRCKCGIAQDKLYAQKCDAVRRWNTRKTGKIDTDTHVPDTNVGDTISRRAAVDSMCELMRHWFGCDPKDEIREIKRELGKLPTIEPEQRQIVRCKDCRKNPKWEWVGCPMAGKDTRKPDDFCSYAEREEE